MISGPHILPNSTSLLPLMPPSIVPELLKLDAALFCNCRLTSKAMPIIYTGAECVQPILTHGRLAHGQGSVIDVLTGSLGKRLSVCCGEGILVRSCPHIT